MPKAKVPFKSLTNLVSQHNLRSDFEYDAKSGEIRQVDVTSKSSSSDEDVSLSAFISCGILPRIQERKPVSIGSIATALSTGSPIADLPTELKIIIFQYATADMEYWLTALSLSLVCREWRAIAHAFPELWTRITVERPKALERWVPWRCFEITWWYLHLAGDAPLHVKMDLLCIDGEAEFLEAAGLVVKQSRRWVEADIRCMPEDLFLFREAKKSGGFPVLRSLGMDVADWNAAGRPCKAFRDAPCLREYAPGGIGPRRCVIYWDTLFTVVLRDFFDGDLCEYLRDASGMQELVIREDCYFETAFGGGGAIPLTASTLTMRSIPRLSHTFMEAYMFPVLSTVDIAIDEKNANGNAVARFIPSFIGMLKQSGCSLKSLSLSHVPMSDESLCAMLSCTPALKSLAIRESTSEHCITDSLLRNLMVTCRDVEAVLVPKLRKLELVWGYDASEDLMLDMIESRIAPTESRVKGLRSVVLGKRHGAELMDVSVKRLCAIRAAGMNASLA